MANDCYFMLKVVGSKESVDKFEALFNAEYSSNKKDNPPHFYRIFNYDVIDEYTTADDKFAREFSGYCAWSVASCMRRDGYYESFNGTDNGKCLEDVTKEYNVDVEYYSEETGVGFQEHCIIKNGEITFDNCVAFLELFNDDDNEFKESLLACKSEILQAIVDLFKQDKDAYNYESLSEAIDKIQNLDDLYKIVKDSIKDCSTKTMLLNQLTDFDYALRIGGYEWNFEI